MSIVRANCFKLQLGAISDDDVARWLNALAQPTVGIVQFYEAEGHQFGVFANWSKYQQTRAKHSKYPPMPADVSTCNHMLAYAPENRETRIERRDYETTRDENRETGLSALPANPPTKKTRVKKIIELSEDFKPLENLRGFTPGDHSAAEATIKAECAISGVPVAEIVKSFVVDYPALKPRFNWKEPIGSLAKTIGIQISKYLNRGGGSNGSRPANPERDQQLSRLADY